MPFSHCVILSLSHSATLSFCHSAILPFLSIALCVCVCVCRGVGPFIQKQFTSYFEQLTQDSTHMDPSPENPTPEDPGEVSMTSS